MQTIRLYHLPSIRRSIKYCRSRTSCRKRASMSSPSRSVPRPRSKRASCSLNYQRKQMGDLAAKTSAIHCNLRISWRIPSRTRCSRPRNLRCAVQHFTATTQADRKLSMHHSNRINSNKSLREAPASIRVQVRYRQPSNTRIWSSRHSKCCKMSNTAHPQQPMSRRPPTSNHSNRRKAVLTMALAVLTCVIAPPARVGADA